MAILLPQIQRGGEQVQSGSLEANLHGKGAILRLRCRRALQILPSAVLLALAFLTSSGAEGQGFSVPKSGPPSGERLFGQQCGACHSITAGEVRVGPSLAGILGRTAGKLQGFSYSSALRTSRLKWGPETLDLWLTNSNAAIPGSVMGYRQPDPAKRLAIIGYLKGLRSK